MPTPVKFTEAKKAFQIGDLDFVTGIETKIWFEGVDLKPKQVKHTMRNLFFEMDRNALALRPGNLENVCPTLKNRLSMAWIN